MAEKWLKAWKSWPLATPLRISTQFNGNGRYAEIVLYTDETLSHI